MFELKIIIRYVCMILCIYNDFFFFIDLMFENQILRLGKEVKRPNI